MNKHLWVGVLLVLLVAAACTSTGDTPQQAESAQNLLPNIAGYEVTDSDTVIDAVTAAAGTAATASGNAPALAGIAKVDQMLQCLQDRGAVASNVYIESSITEGILPKAGIVAVINQTRVRDNFLNCALGGQEQNGFAPQSAIVEPCASSGSFVFRGDDISFVYVATQPDLCSAFQGHFDALEQNQ